MLLKLGPQEKLEFRMAAFDLPTGQYLREPLGVYDTLTATILCLVATKATRKYRNLVQRTAEPRDSNSHSHQHENKHCDRIITQVRQIRTL